MEKRLSKTLAAAGVASRRACETLIFEGHVKVNGKIVLVPQTLVGPSDIITVNEAEISKEEKKVYFMFNKPHGCLCTAKRDSRTKIVLDFFANIEQRLFTVGRLDRDTTGLILVTNDGHFANGVIHPSSNISKEYLVKTNVEITDHHLKMISAGVHLEEGFVKPKSVKKVRKGTIKIVVMEGRKREVRRLVEAAGLKVKELARIRIGGLQLGTLPIGQWRPLSEKERLLIFG